MNPTPPASAELDAAITLLTTPPPTVELETVRAIAHSHYDWDAVCTPMAGERDRNFLLARSDAAPVTLKFINASESPQETDLQVQVLAHLERQDLPIQTPQPLTTLDGQASFHLETAGGPLRGRAYTYLQGTPAVHTPGSARHRTSVGKMVAQLDRALHGFQHPAKTRIFLWDLMHVPHLAAFSQHVGDPRLRHFIADFLDHFARCTLAAVSGLPHQFIHADLSKSNLLVDPADPEIVVGVLDFGDMVYAPRIADLAIAASYQMGNAGDPMAALEQVVQGFQSESPLLPQEREHLLDFVMARLVQRLVITEWRAARFPENREYILRSNPEAQSLLHALMPIWRSDSQRRLAPTGLERKTAP